MVRIVLLSGSLRRGSLNSTAIETVQHILDSSSDAVETVRLPLHTLPFYHQDFDEEGRTCEAVLHARDTVRSSDAVIISTPSYNGLLSGVLKNALDWLSRPWGDSALTGMPTAFLSASTGPRGARDAHQGLCTVLERSGAALIDTPAVALCHADTLATRRGRFTDPDAVTALEGLVRAVLAHIDPVPAVGGLPVTTSSVRVGAMG